MASTETSPLMTLMSLPDDLLQRLLVGVPLEDHRAAASACVAFCDVINGPKFLALRRQYGFAERGVVLLQTRAISGTSLKIRAARKNGDVSLPTICSHPSTTDGGSRLFVSSLELVPNQRERIMAVDVSSCRWKCVTALPMVFRENSLPGHCMEWHGGLLYVAGGRDNEDNTLVLMDKARTILSTCSMKRLTRGRSCLLCHMPPRLRHRVSLVTNCSLWVVPVLQGPS